MQVHHQMYFPSTDPWDYEDDYLITLCPYCHQQEEAQKVFQEGVIEYLLVRGMTRQKINKILILVSQRLCRLPVNLGEEIEKICATINRDNSD